MPKSLVQIDPSNGQVTVLQRNISPETFVPSDYPNPSNVFIVRSNIQSFEGTIYTGFTTPNQPVADGIGSFSTIPPSTTTSSISANIFGLAEQQMDGTAYGTFSPTELVFQSNIRPEIINYLSLSGVTASDYNPTVGSIGVTGYVGGGAAQFKGSYLDTDTAAAGISLPGFTTASYFLISGWVYMESTPSAYDPIIITRSPDGVDGSGTTSDSFRLEYDRSSARFQFNFSTTANTTTPGFDYTINVSPSGVTLNQWNHFAVAYSKPSAGNTAYVSSYWNGNQISYDAGKTGSLRGSRSSLYIGCSGTGKKSFKGWLDDLIISAGTTGDVLRGFLHGTTAPVPTLQQDAGFYTVYYMSMDGPIGTSYFPCDTTNKVVSNLAFGNQSKMYVYGTIGVTSSRMWTSFINGVCGGYTAGNSTGYIFGYNSGACFIPTAVTDLVSGLTAAKQYRKDLMDYTMRYYLGFTAMRGSSGASGDFVNLYSGTTFPTSFTYLPTESNLNYLANIYNAIVVCGSTLSVGIEDANGVYYSFATAGAVNVYKDVLTYYNNINTDRLSVNNTIDSKNSFLALKQVQGYTKQAVISRLAQGGNPSVMIPAVAAITGFSRNPEDGYNLSAESTPLATAVY